MPHHPHLPWKKTNSAFKKFTERKDKKMAEQTTGKWGPAFGENIAKNRKRGVRSLFKRS